MFNKLFVSTIPDATAMGVSLQSEIRDSTIDTKNSNTLDIFLTASSSSLYILTVLSASQVINRVPLWSKQLANTPASESIEPGWATDVVFWKQKPERQSQKCMLPLSAIKQKDCLIAKWNSLRHYYSPPETITPSGLTEIVFKMALWPVRFCINSPLGHFHCLMFSGDADANI